MFDSFCINLKPVWMQSFIVYQSRWIFIKITFQIKTFYQTKMCLMIFFCYITRVKKNFICTVISRTLNFGQNNTNQEYATLFNEINFLFTFSLTFLISQNADMEWTYNHIAFIVISNINFKIKNLQISQKKLLNQNWQRFFWVYTLIHCLHSQKYII